jgi:hypothetical protein
MPTITLIRRPVALETGVLTDFAGFSRVCIDKNL